MTIRGNEWKVKLVTRRDMPRNHWGDCDWDKRVIRVRRDLSPKNFLDTLIHEVRHAQHEICYEAENYISWTSTNLAEIILATELVKVFTGKKCRNGNKV